ncbi:hypothetical protein [Taibaiella koreensis]|uniref:hypothetical protein n=1 Tax=Taibaiella koreensis TaxID=1268548 RepID=UPI000E59D64E|nr:hypothetical protein [Taibaiella koreensis]
MSEFSHPPVPEDQAIAWTTNWRNYYGSITGTDPNDALRAFKIPLEDLQALVDMAKDDNNIDSVRAYLALTEDRVGDVINASEVHIVLVPVAKNPNIMPPVPDPGIDILQASKAGKTVSTIMDFTTPCPAMCDFQSPLYGIKE